MRILDNLHQSNGLTCYFCASNEIIYYCCFINGTIYYYSSTARTNHYCYAINGTTMADILGFTGEFCDDDINECEGDPCANGATCQVHPGREEILEFIKF